MSYFARLSKEKKLEMWREMCLARFMDLKIRYDIKESGDSQIPTVALLGLGEEAVSVGASFVCDSGRDWLVPGHRVKGALVHFGVTPLEDLSNHMCKADSPMRGRDGNVHYTFPGKHIVKFISHMAANWPTGAGIAEGLKYLYELEDKNEKMEFVICFCGDGASRQGTFHEVINFAATRNLPIGFVIDNNAMATDTPIEEQTAAIRISDSALGYNIAGEYIANGNDVITVYNHAARLVERARELAKHTEFLKKNDLPRAPFILECRTFRMAEHNETRKANCVDIFDFIEWGALDPLRIFREALLGFRSVEGIKAISDREPGRMFSVEALEITREELESISEKAGEEVDRAYDEAKQMRDPEPDESLRKIFPSEVVIKNPRRVEPFDAAYILRTKVSATERKSQIPYGVALRNVIVEVMKENPKIRIFGEDVGGRLVEGEMRGGGVYNITHDALIDPELGPKRCFNTPLSEIAIVGAAIGQSLIGLVPIAEIQYLPFASVALSQLIDFLPTWFWTAGISLNPIFRLPCGGGKSAGEFHSSMRLEATFFHTPGLKMVHPSTPADVMGMFRSAVRDDSPILFFESLWALSSVIGKINPDRVIIGPAALRQEGKDITIIAWGARNWFDAVLPAVNSMAKDGINCELIDLRTLSPLDLDFLVQSLKKTHRVLIVHEDIQRGGVGESIAQQIQREAGEYLLTPYIAVVGSEFCPMPQHPKLERWCLPSEEKVLAEARKLLEYK